MLLNNLNNKKKLFKKKRLKQPNFSKFLNLHKAKAQLIAMYREKEATLEVGTVRVTSFGDSEKENLVEASVGPNAKPSTLPTRPRP
jgi:hypothetical protein